jgi:uncharacterized membrane protein
MARQEEEKNNQDLTKDLAPYRLIEKYLIPIAITIIVLTLFTYIAVFADKLPFLTGIFSTKISEWGQFGDYFGGILNPILSFIAIIVLIITLRIGYETLKISKVELEKATEMLEHAKTEVEALKEQTQKQIKHVENESYKNEIFKILQEIDGNIQSIFNLTIEKSGGGLTFGDYYKNFSKRNLSAEVEYSKLHPNDKLHLENLCNLLQNMDFYLKIHEDSFDKGDTKAL